MHGNVWEWCDDHYHPDHEGAPSIAKSRWKGRADGDRVVRGGSWTLRGQGRALRFSQQVEPGDRLVSLGFRCAGVQEA